MADDAAVLLRASRQEAGYILERNERYVEAVAEADETCRLVRGVDVEHAGQKSRIVRDDADRRPPSRANPITTFLAKWGITSKK